MSPIRPGQGRASWARGRATHKTLLYQVKKRLQQQQTLRQLKALEMAGETDGTSGGTYRAVAPSVVSNRLGASPLLDTAALRTLSSQRYVVVDDALDATLIAGAAREMRGLYKGTIAGDAPSRLETTLGATAR